MTKVRRNGRKASEMTAEELEIVRKYERDYRATKRAKDTKENASKVKEQLSSDLGRPLKKQEIMQVEMSERHNSFIHFFYKYNGNISAACAAVGIKRSTFNIWMKECPEISEHIIEVEDTMLDMAEQQLYKNIAKGKENSLFFFLCNKGKKRGWQDIRKLAAPKMPGIKINILYPEDSKNVRRIRPVTSKVIESGGQ